MLNVHPITTAFRNILDPSIARAVTVSFSHPSFVFIQQGWVKEVGLVDYLLNPGQEFQPMVNFCTLFYTTTPIIGSALFEAMLEKSDMGGRATDKLRVNLGKVGAYSHGLELLYRTLSEPGKLGKAVGECNR